SYEIDWLNPYAQRFKKGLDDDFNTPEALAVIFDLANEVNKDTNSSNKDLLVKLSNILGILTLEPESFLQGDSNGLIDIEKLIQDRDMAKINKDFEKADKIREILLENDILIEDTPNGTVWRKK
ncbi:MAG TPA: cysteine--tRNA ligase, partial [Nitrospinaceae bacterium]|nr:cysteine--tRNA ligase [Nitrospinaceae bacterium]